MPCRRIAVPLALLAFSLACSDSTSPRTTPAEPLKFIDIVTNLAPRSYSPTASCGIAADSTVYCWGSNRSGRLGLPTTSGQCPDAGFGGQISCERQPVRVPGAPKLARLAGGTDYFCGLAADGTPYCWGAALTASAEGLDFGNSPTPLPGGLHLSQLSAGLAYLCGTTTAGQGVCWGDYQGGVRGDPSVDPDTASATLTPNLIPGLGFQTVVARANSTCGLTVTGAAYCWGGDYNGSLGADASGVDQPKCGAGWAPCTLTPVAVAGGHTFISLTGGRYHFCGLTAAGDAWCWGPSTGGALTGASDLTVCTSVGVPPILCAPEPVLLPRFQPWKVVVAGDLTTCGLIADGTATCWGNNDYGQAGNGGGPADVDHPVAGGLHFRVIAPGTDHTCGITTDSLAYCWGEGSAGQLGDGTGEDATVPVAVIGPAAP